MPRPLPPSNTDNSHYIYTTYNPFHHLHITPSNTKKQLYCKFWIYWVGVNTKFTIWQQILSPLYCKFWIYWVGVNTKFTIWQQILSPFLPNVYRHRTPPTTTWYPHLTPPPQYTDTNAYHNRTLTTITTTNNHWHHRHDYHQ